MVIDSAKKLLPLFELGPGVPGIEGPSDRDLHTQKCINDLEPAAPVCGSVDPSVQPERMLSTGDGGDPMAD